MDKWMTSAAQRDAFSDAFVMFRFTMDKLETYHIQIMVLNSRYTQKARGRGISRLGNN